MQLFIGLLFGLVGGVYVAYARRIHEADFLICGVALMVYPYFFNSLILIIVVGAILAVIPIARRRGWV